MWVRGGDRGTMVPGGQPSPHTGVSPLGLRGGVCHARSMNLVRPRHGRVFAGVCAAIANRYQWNPTTVRVLTIAVDRPVCKNVDRASTSVVMRVMIRPDSSRS